MAETELLTKEQSPEGKRRRFKGRDKACVETRHALSLLINTIQLLPRSLVGVFQLSSGLFNAAAEARLSACRRQSLVPPLKLRRHADGDARPVDSSHAIGGTSRIADLTGNPELKQLVEKFGESYFDFTDKEKKSSKKILSEFIIKMEKNPLQEKFSAYGNNNT